MRKKVLIVDDSKFNREMLRDALSDEYETAEAGNGVEALEYIEAHRAELVAVLLDIVMPEMDGVELLKILNEKEYMDTFPVIIVTAEQPASVVEECFDYGISDFIRKPIKNTLIRKRVDKQVSLYVQKNELQEMVDKQTVTVKSQFSMLQKQAEKLRRANENIINILGTVVEFRSLETGDHVRCVKQFTRILAQHLAKEYPEYGLDEVKIDAITAASALYDIGKIFIPDAILLKPGKLTQMERDLMRSHVLRGSEALQKISGDWNADYAKYAYEICKYHHERFDGNGYPEGLVGDEIPIAAQLVSVADCYDNLISERAYKQAYSLDRSYQMIINGECGVFSPKILQCFRNARRELEEEVKK